MTTAEIVQLQTTAVENAKFRLGYLREELEQLKLFVKSGRIVGPSDDFDFVLATNRSEPRKSRTWTAAQRRAQSRKLKAVWRARKAAK